MKLKIPSISIIIVVLLALFSIAATTLTLEDQTDSATYYSYEDVDFYANFSNGTSGIYALNTSCNISFNTGSGWSSWNNMVYNIVTELYTYNRSFSSPGNYSYNTTCSGSALGYGCKNKTNNFTITTDTTPPNSTSVGSTVNYQSANISITTNKTSNITISYGTGQTSLSSTAVETDFGTTHTVGLSSLSADTQYYFNVTMCNRDGYCLDRGPYTFTTDEAPDISGPTITFTQPTSSNTTTYTDWKNLFISITTNEDSTCVIDTYKTGSSTVTTDTTMATSNSRTHTKYLNATGDSAGYNFYVTVECTDASSNTQSKTAYMKVEDTTKPSISFTSATVGDEKSTSSRNPTIYVSVSETMYSGYPKISVDGASQTSMTYDSGNYKYTTSTLSEGGHNVTVFAKDQKGNEKNNTRTFTVDITEPEIDVLKPEDDGTLKDCSILEFNLTMDEDGTCEYELFKYDEEDYEDCNDRCDNKYDDCIEDADSSSERSDCSDERDDCEDECEEDKYQEFDNDDLEQEYGISECQDDCDDIQDDCEDECKDERSICYSDSYDSDDREECTDDYDDCVEDCQDDGEYCCEDCEDEGYVFYEEFTKCFNDAEYVVTFICQDEAENEVRENVTFTIKDTNPPSITNLGPNGTIYENEARLKVTTNEDSRCRFSESDVSYAKMESLFSQASDYHTYDMTNLDNGNYTYYVACNDSRGNVMLGNEKISFTIDGLSSSSSESSTSTSTTDSSGTDTVTSNPTVTKTFSSIKADEDTIIEIDDTKISVREITIKLNEDVSDAGVTIEKMASQSLVEKPKDTLYEYFTVSKTGMTNKQISNVNIKFRVENKWITNNKIDPEKIVLNKYTDKWETVTPLKTSEDKTYSYYQAEVSDLSMFAITGQKLVTQDSTTTPANNQDSTDTNASEQKDANEEEPTIIIEKKSSWLWLWILLLCVLVVGGGSAAFVIFRTNRHPQHDLSAADQKQLTQESAAASQEAADTPLTSEMVKDTQIQDNIEQTQTENQNPMLNYILTSKEAGMSPQDIYANLLEAGYEENPIIGELIRQNLVKDEVVDYINSALQSGLTPDDIYTTLYENGYEEVDILNRFEQIGINVSSHIARDMPQDAPSEEEEEIKIEQQEEMAEQEYENGIEDYIKSSIDAGYPADDIKNALVEAGHDENIIHELFNKVIPVPLAPNIEEPIQEVVQESGPIVKEQSEQYKQPKQTKKAKTKKEEKDTSETIINQELRDYVKGCLEEKMAKFHIKKLLKNAGYSKDDIKLVLKEIPQLKKELKFEKKKKKQ